MILDRWSLVSLHVPSFVCGGIARSKIGATAVTLFDPSLQGQESLWWQSVLISRQEVSLTRAADSDESCEAKGKRRGESSLAEDN